MFLSNPLRKSAARPRPKLLDALGRDGRKAAGALLAHCPAHRPTPLLHLPSLAARLGVAEIAVKDESLRFGLKSFKALGGAYAVMRLVLAEAEARFGRAVSPAELQSAAVRDVARKVTVTSATDGNHGRSVAAGARLAGCKAIIFVHAGVSVARVEAIEGFGATVLRVPGSYDDSVAQASRQAAQRGWTVVSDTSWDGYEDIPLTVMQGYTVMAGEAFDACGVAPTHVFAQAGVGGMAAAVAAHAVAVYGDEAPALVVVEPERAACLFESARTGRAVAIPHGEPTIMGMLECLEPSRLAWEILAPLASGFVTLPEQAAPEAMRMLAHPRADDPAIESGESGCTGLAGLIACLNNRDAREELRLGPASRILLINSEGATDPELYQHIIKSMPSEENA